MNKNKNSDYNIIFENPNLLNYFTVGSIFDTSQVQLFENEEISLVKELIDRGDEVEIRMVPADKKMLAKNVL